MTRANDAPVTVERPISEHPCHGRFPLAGDRLTHRQWTRNGKLMPTCERCGTPIDHEHNEAGPVSWVPEQRLAALASAPAEPLPDIGPDPFKGPREDDRYEGSRLRLRAAYAQQQKGVPDQTALVWRYDLGTVLEMAIRLKSILADDEEPASAPAGDAFADAGKPIVPAGDGASRRDAGPDCTCAARFYAGPTPDAHQSECAALARPRAAVGEQSREAIARLLYGWSPAIHGGRYDAAMARGEPFGTFVYAGWGEVAPEVHDIYLTRADAILALQSPPAKVEGINHG